MSTKIHKKFLREFTQKMSTKIHPKRGILVDKSVHENSPKVSTKIYSFCPRKFACYVHEKSATPYVHVSAGLHLVIWLILILRKPWKLQKCIYAIAAAHRQHSRRRILLIWLICLCKDPRLDAKRKTSKTSYCEIWKERL